MMRVKLHILSDNYINYKEKRLYIDSKDLNIKTLINYLYNYNIIDTTDYKIYHNNKEINEINEIKEIDNINDVTLILKENIYCNCCTCECNCKYLSQNQIYTQIQQKIRSHL